jgi:hypothetical protein
MAYRLFYWVVLIPAFLVGGVLETLDFLPRARLSGPDASLDAMALQDLQIEHGAEIMRQNLRRLPLDRPILVVGPGEDWKISEVQQLTSYLAWPRQVWSIGLMPGGQTSKFDYRPPAQLDYSAVFFYQMTPPGDEPREMIGEHLMMIRRGARP